MTHRLGLAGGLALALCVAGSTTASAATGGPYETSNYAVSCQGNWSYDGTSLTVDGTATDRDPTDGQPPVCDFMVTYEAPRTFEFYSGTGTFGPYRFTQAKTPVKLDVQACVTERMGMHECGVIVTLWKR